MEYAIPVLYSSLLVAPEVATSIAGAALLGQGRLSVEAPSTLA